MNGNPLDWGSSPLVVGLMRGIAAAIVAGGIAYFGAQLSGTPEETARLIGYVAILTPLGALFSLGAYDQNRANNGIVQAGDVPVAALAQNDKATPQQVANVIEADIKRKAG